MNAAFYVKITNNVVEDAEFVFGGMSATAIIAQNTKSLIINSKWSEAMLDNVYLELLKDLPLPSNAPGGMVTYRKTLALRYTLWCVFIQYIIVLWCSRRWYYVIFSLFLKFYHYVCKKLNMETLDVYNLKNDADNVGNNSKYAQYYQIVPNSHSPDDLIGKPLVHMSAVQQTTGNEFKIRI